MCVCVSFHAVLSAWNILPSLLYSLLDSYLFFILISISLQKITVFDSLSIEQTWGQRAGVQALYLGGDSRKNQCERVPGGPWREGALMHELPGKLKLKPTGAFWEMAGNTFQSCPTWGQWSWDVYPPALICHCLKTAPKSINSPALPVCPTCGCREIP